MYFRGQHHTYVSKAPCVLPSCRLGLLLLHERYKTDSKWQPYVENLPTRVKGVPLSSFGIADMRALQDDKLTEKIDERCVFDYDISIVWELLHRGDNTVVVF